MRRVDNLTAREGLDVLVNAAGYALVGVETLSKRGGPAPVRTNAFGLLNVTRAFLPHMRERHSGRPWTSASE